MILLSWVHICKNECLFLSLILNNSIKSYPSGPFLKLIRSLQDGSAPALTQLPIQYWISIVSLVLAKLNTLAYINNDIGLLVDKTTIITDTVRRRQNIGMSVLKNSWEVFSISTYLDTTANAVLDQHHFIGYNKNKHSKIYQQWHRSSCWQDHL